MSLQVKIVSGILLVLLLIFASVGFLNWRSIQRVSTLLEASIDREGKSLITATSEALALSLPSRDYALVEAYGANLLQGRENIRRLLIFDEEGEIVFAYPEDLAVADNMLDPSLMQQLQEENSVISQIAGSNYQLLGALKTSEFGDAEAKYVFGFVSIWLYRGYIEQEVKSWMTMCVGVFAVIMIVALGLSYLLFTRAITHPINRVARFVKNVASGDLSETSYRSLRLNAHRKDEIGAMMNAVMDMKNMLQRLNTIVVEVRTSADTVASGSQEIRFRTEQMSQGMTKQGTAAQEVASSMEQMAANIRQNADNALQTERIALLAAKDAQEGGQAVIQVVTAMQEIAQNISIIEEIARQTHLLSLNATIEAARAEERGKGFGVVAQEVRALAEKSREAAEVINTLVSTSVDMAQNAGEMLKKLVPDIQRTSVLIQEISAASAEQRTSVDQINQSIQQLDQIIQLNALASREIALTSEKLTNQADQLWRSMEFFKIDETR